MDHDQTSPDDALPQDRWHAAWTAALNDVELQADHVEQVLTAVHRGTELPAALDVLARRWEPPADLGPMPPSFVARAQALLLRHSTLSEQIAQAVATTRRHEQAVDSLGARGPSVPAFVDVAL